MGGDQLTWDEIPLKHLADIRVSNVDKKIVPGQPTVRLCNYTDVYYRDTITSDQEFMEATATPEQVETFRLQPGDVIITKDSETPEDIGVPAFVANAAPDLVCGYHLAVIRPRRDRVAPRFLYWSMCSRGIRAQLTVAATGVTRFGLRTGAIKDVRVSMPSFHHQCSIVQFLDAETARLDRVSALIQRQLPLLSERRDALITEAITGHLDR